MFKGLAELLKYFRDERHWKSEKKDAALRAIRVALQETKTYVTSINNGQPESRAKEEHLSDLWSQAALAARVVDRELARRLGVKSNYWLEPETWTIDDAFDASIRLDGIEREYQELLESIP